MAIKATAESTVNDLSDAYTVMQTHPAHAFAGTTGAAVAASTTDQIVAMRGKTQVAASVTVADIVAPAGVTVTSDNDTTSPTLTIAVTAAVTTGGVVKIPVVIADPKGNVTIELQFGFTIAFTGATGVGVRSTDVEYQTGTSGTTAPTGTWSATVPAVAARNYLWTRVVTTYTDGSTSTAYSVGMMGQTGNPGRGISSTATTYQAGSSGTTAPTGTWGSSIPAVGASQYLWTRTIVSYTDSTSSTSYSVGMMGATGAAALSIVLTTDNGTTLKNGSGSTTYTANVFLGSLLLSAGTTPTLASEGTVKWYVGSSTTAVATGPTYTVHASDFVDTEVVHAQLEG